MEKIYTYRLLPTEVQKTLINQWIGCSRYVYNKGLEEKIKSSTTGNIVKCTELMRELCILKNKNQWLRNCPSQVLQMSLRQLDNNYLLYKKGGIYPTFQTKKNDRSIRFPQGIKISYRDNTVKIPKLNTVSCKLDRKFRGIIKLTTLYKTVTNKFFIKILVDNQDESPSKKTIDNPTTIGISTGINTWFGLSNGTRISKPARISKSETKVRVQIRALGRKKIGSKRREKQLKHLLISQERLANQKRDYLQKVTTKIISEYNTVIIENIPNEIKRILEYKCRWYGNNYIEIGRCSPCANICSLCGVIDKAATISWICSSCGTLHNRNKNKAENIKKIGLRNKPSVANRQTID